MGMWAGGRDATPPWRSKTSSLPCRRKMGTNHVKRVHSLFYTLFSRAEKLHCLQYTVQAIFLFLAIEKLCHLPSKNFKKLLSFCCHFFIKIFPLLHSPFTQAMAAKNITSPGSIFDPCTHEKNLHLLYEKSCAHVCLRYCIFGGNIGYSLPPHTWARGGYR